MAALEMTSNKVVIWRCGKFVSSEYACSHDTQNLMNISFFNYLMVHSEREPCFRCQENILPFWIVKAVDREWNSCSEFHIKHFIVFIPFRLMAYGSIMVELLFVNSHLHKLIPHSNEINIYVICLTLSNGTKNRI